MRGKWFESIWGSDWNQRLENLANTATIILFVVGLTGGVITVVGWVVARLRGLTVSMDWPGWVSLVWLIMLTLYVWRSGRALRAELESLSRRIAARDFRDDFAHGLEQWEYEGEWKTVQDDGHHILVVTNSFNGGYALPCRLWHDYTFEFETKIVQANSAWIIRASDILNYVMLQCGQGEIIPHFKVDGRFYKLKAITVSRELPLRQWFAVAIKVLKTRVAVNITFEGEEQCILDLPLLRPQVHKGTIPQGDTMREVDVPCSFPLGSVGFREAGFEECAYFRNVRVTRI